MVWQLTTLTPAAVLQNLQNSGLDTLGLTTVRLSPQWADSAATVSYQADDLTLDITGANIIAPFLGIREFMYTPVSGTLDEDITENSTTLKLEAGEGSGFPAPPAAQPNDAAMMVVLSNDAGTQREVVACTAVNGDQLTVVRGHDGTAKQTFAKGSTVRLRVPLGVRTSQFLGVDGLPLTGNIVVLRMHPQAILRLQTLMADRYPVEDGAPITPVPWSMVIRDVVGFTTPRWVRAGNTLTDPSIPSVSGTISFHDGRGQIIDPIYVAALFLDLLQVLPGLLPTDGTLNQANTTNGLSNISNIAGGARVHIVDLHGGVFKVAHAGSVMMHSSGNTNTIIDTTLQSGLVDVSTGDVIRAAGSDTEKRLRWGWAVNGTLRQDDLTIPTHPLPRVFYRIAVVDKDWMLLGNRTASTIQQIPADDGTIPSDLLPVVRDNIEIDYLTDGPDMLAEVTRMMDKPNEEMLLAVTPDVDSTMHTPTAPGVNSHWPTYPTPDTAIASVSAIQLELVGAAVSGTRDVVVTILGGTLPDGAHVRIYPRQFVEIAAIAKEPSYLRADGGAMIASGNADVGVFLKNPFGLVDGQPMPNPAILSMDVVVTPRRGDLQMFGNVSVVVAAGPATPPPDRFAPQAGEQLWVIAAMATQIPTFFSIASSPLFGIPRTLPPPPSPGNSLVDLLISLASDTPPRQAPRLPTMARFDSLAAIGVPGTGNVGDPQPNPSGSLFWEAVLSGGRFSRESRSANHALGNPGNPAGPDIHAPGVRMTGALAYDVAVLAAHRVQPMIPIPVPNNQYVGWIILMGGNNFNVPDDSANTNNTGVGVLLQTIAKGCETPWLGPLSPPPPNVLLDDLIDDAIDEMGINNFDVDLDVNNEPRLQRQVRRDFFVSRHGIRDTLWSLRRACSQATELIYIESPQFNATAQPNEGLVAAQVDLVQIIHARLEDKDAPNLKVIICMPKDPDFGYEYKGWWRHHYAARRDAINLLLSVAPDRVLAFHPVGFPGRTAFIRTTSVIVDDVWSLVGSTHFRRRGMTFDGSSAIASFDCRLREGYSEKVREYRRALMAQKLQVETPDSTSPGNADWLRLAYPSSTFTLIQDMLNQGGLGRIKPLYPGPNDNTVQAHNPNLADPDGTSDTQYLTILAGQLNEAGS